MDYSSWLAMRGSILAGLCDFREAIAVLDLEEFTDDVFAASAANNRAVSFEHLGDLEQANRNQSLALKLSRRAGSLVGEMQSLANLGAFETKRGNFSGATLFFRQARTFYQATHLYRKDDRSKVLPLMADDTELQISLGEYSKADILISSALRRLRYDATSQKAIWLALQAGEFYAQIGQPARARRALRRVQDSELYRSEFFSVEHALITCRIDGPSEKTRCDLTKAFETTEKLGTLYQRCRVLVELAEIGIKDGFLKESRNRLLAAQKLATGNQYGLLKPRITFLRAFTTESSATKERFLMKSLRTASNLPLPELVAESLFRIGQHQLENGEIRKAREYLQNSISTTEVLAGNLPIRARQHYLKLHWRNEARSMLDEVDRLIATQAHLQGGYGTGVAEARSLAKSLYTFTMAIGKASNPEELVEQVNTTLARSLKCRVVSCLTINDRLESRVKKIQLTESLKRVISELHGNERAAPYFCQRPTQRQRKESSSVSIAWIPLITRGTRFGGIYVEIGPRQLLETEMEFMTSIGVIASNVLAAILWSSSVPESAVEEARFQGIVGRSRRIRQVCSQIEIASQATATVLIEGESGTGKELVARAIHENSERARGPLITVDCGAIPDTLIESELFGSRRGSFTGATGDRAGLVEAAHGGTLFLDEIANTSPSLQIRLLRVLQEREVRRIGDTKGRAVDVRLIAATNANLELLVGRKQFRQDLFYRLQVLHITIPPLRERKDDIPDLARSFLDELNRSNGTRKRFSRAALEDLTTGHYRGNVRELQNVVERAYLMAAKRSTINQVSVDSSELPDAERDEVYSWFKELREGRVDFWTAVYSPYKSRDISREKVVALIDLGLRETRGVYKSVAELFQVKDEDYRKFDDFLRRNNCKLDFRPYRKRAIAPPERERNARHEKDKT